MKQFFLVDTTVFIRSFRGDKRAAKFLILQGDKVSLSYVTWGELLQGVRTRAHSVWLDDLPLTYKVVWGSRKIEKSAIELLKMHIRHGLNLSDALIAATAMENDMTLVTHNLKHFKKVKGLKAKLPT